MSEKLEHGRRRRGGREEMHQTAAKKAKCKEAKEKKYGRQARKVRARSKNERRKGGNAPSSR